jgi:hypothetical protein
MKATAIVNGKVVSFRLSRGLAAAHRRNSGQSLSATQAVDLVERLRRRRTEKLRAFARAAHSSTCPRFCHSSSN